MTYGVRERTCSDPSPITPGPVHRYTSTSSSTAIIAPCFLTGGVVHRFLPLKYRAWPGAGASSVRDRSLPRWQSDGFPPASSSGNRLGLLAVSLLSPCSYARNIDLGTKIANEMPQLRSGSATSWDTHAGPFSWHVGIWLHTTKRAACPPLHSDRAAIAAGTCLIPG